MVKRKIKMMVCPQCSYEQEQSNECIECGIIIEKYLAIQERKQKRLTKEQLVLEFIHILANYNYEKEYNILHLSRFKFVKRKEFAFLYNLMQGALLNCVIEKAYPECHESINNFLVNNLETSLSEKGFPADEIIQTFYEFRISLGSCSPEEMLGIAGNFVARYSNTNSISKYSNQAIKLSETISSFHDYLYDNCLKYKIIEK